MEIKFSELKNLKLWVHFYVKKCSDVAVLHVYSTTYLYFNEYSEQWCFWGEVLRCDLNWSTVSSELSLTSH